MTAPEYRRLVREWLRDIVTVFLLLVAAAADWFWKKWEGR